MSLRIEFIFVCFILLSVFGLMNNAYSNDGDGDGSDQPKVASPAPTSEDVPKLDPDLPEGNGEVSARKKIEDKEKENHPPRIVSVVVTPERPTAGICTVTDSKGVPVLCTIIATATDDDGDYPLEYKFDFLPGGTEGYLENNGRVIECGSDPGTTIVEVTVRDSRGAESAIVQKFIAILSSKQADLMAESEKGLNPKKARISFSDIRG